MTAVEETIMLGKAGYTKVILRAYPGETENIDLDIYFADEHAAGVRLDEKSRDEVIYQILHMGRVATTGAGS